MPATVLAPERGVAKKRLSPAAKRTLWGLGLGMLAAGLLALGAFSPAFARAFVLASRSWNAVYSLLFSPLPFSAAEIALLAGGAWALFCLFRLVFRLIRRPGGRKALLLAYLSRLVLTGGCLALAFSALWGVCYSDPGLTDLLGLDIRPRSTEELYAVCVDMLTEAARLAPAVPRDGEGICDFGAFSTLAGGVSGAYGRLAEAEPFFTAPFYPAPKRVLLSELMSRFGISGIYAPFTAEANVNGLTPHSHLPFTMCHEAAHRLGLAREEDANFAAFLACISSGDIQYNYSGYLLAYIYASNALYRTDREAAYGLSDLESPEIKSDLAYYSAYLRQFEGPATSLGTAANNTYLRAMGQSDGVRSYGRVVDLLCAWHERQGA